MVRELIEKAPTAVCAAFALLLTLTPVVAAQQAAQSPGQWRGLQESTHLGRCHRALEAAEVRAMLDALDPVLDGFRRAPTLRAARGFDVQPRRIVHAWPEVPVDRNCLGAELMILLHRLYPDPDCKACPPRASPDYAGSVWVYANNPFPPLLEELRVRRGSDDVRTGMFLAPREVGNGGGLPVYEAQRGWWVAVAAAGTRFWRPVTRERFLRMRLDEARGRVAELEAAQPRAATSDDMARRWEEGREERERTYEQLRRINPQAADQYREQMAKMEADFARAFRDIGDDDGSRAAAALEQARGRVARIEAEIASYSPAELLVDAWCCDPRDAIGSRLLPPGSVGRPVVEAEPGFLDAVRSASTTRLLFVRFRWSGLEDRSRDRILDRVLEQVRDELDWAALADTVGR